MSHRVTKVPRQGFHNLYRILFWFTSADPEQKVWEGFPYNE